MVKIADAAPLLKYAGDAWAIFNILKTLHAALPDDPIDCEVPTRCLLSHVVSLTETLADTLMELSDDQ